ncbi:MAG TPA: response regulator [Ktedonobacter sp.]|jgi:CheY-like chemotaxis protein|nr:response regulator [Ktedonobacter sp.]HAG98323.1 response regulator [Ktedonobacter sp.]HAT47124.1 response regulator [Ktedonobacter sp.]HBE26354.1 response regulator [Ktedonobacter sp.]HBE27287.1 response regulator [Ktedonobacter sp.]
MNTPLPDRGQPTILVVENEVSNRILIERVLSTRGYYCLSASNGKEALEILDRERVDLILTDLSMPVLDGYRTTQLIRARPALANVPIVAVTAYALNDENEAALQIGCNEYLTKPFKPRQLLEVVDRLLPQR